MTGRALPTKSASPFHAARSGGRPPPATKVGPPTCDRFQGWLPGSATCLTCHRARGSRDPRVLVFPEELAQLVLGLLLRLALCRRQARARPVDIEGQHRERRAQRRGFARCLGHATTTTC